jgi:hypothetical protein
MDNLIKTVEREKWYPTVKSTSSEMQLAYTFNAFLDSIKDMNDEEEIMSLLRVYKQAMMNVALALHKEL